jgi:hypothetical protein
MSIECIQGKRSSLARNSRYTAYLSSIPENPTVTAFIDMKEIVGNSRKPISESPATMDFLKSCETAGIWTDIHRKNIKGEAILTFIPGKLTRSLENARSTSPGTALLDMLPFFPQNISNYAAMDMFSLLELFGTITIPEKNRNLSDIWRLIFQKRLGSSWEEEIKPAITGRIALSYELGELLFDGIYSKFGGEKTTKQLNRCTMNLSNIAMACDFYKLDHRNSLPPDLDSLVPGYLQAIPRCPAGGTYVYTPTGDKAYRINCRTNAHKALGIKGDNPFYTSGAGLGGNNPTQAVRQNTLASIPFLIALQVNDRVKARQIVQKFASGHSFISTDYKGNEISVSLTGESAYAFIGNYMMLECGACAPGKIKKTIDALINGKKSIAQSRSYRKFQESLSGSIIFICHDKIDWLSSLGKSFLLLAGSDFRDWAQMVGEYEDSWSALSVDQGKVRFIFEITGE